MPVLDALAWANIRMLVLDALAWAWKRIHGLPGITRCWQMSLSMVSKYMVGYERERERDRTVHVLWREADPKR